LTGEWDWRSRRRHSLSLSREIQAAGAFARARQSLSASTDLRAAGSRINERARLIVRGAGDSGALAVRADLAIATIRVRPAEASLTAGTVLRAADVRVAVPGFAADRSGRRARQAGARDLHIAAEVPRRRESRKRREQGPAGATICQDLRQGVESATVHPAPRRPSRPGGAQLEKASVMTSSVPFDRPCPSSYTVANVNVTIHAWNLSHHSYWKAIVPPDGSRPRRAPRPHAGKIRQAFEWQGARTAASVNRRITATSCRRGTRSSNRRRVVGGYASPPGDVLQ
jgi:hypothetical protein